MNAFLDEGLVGLALLFSVGYAVSALGPRAWRGQILASMGRVMSHLPPLLGVSRLARRITAAAAAKSQGACGGCDTCGSDATTPAAPAGEIKIPLSKIGRRT